MDCSQAFKKPYYLAQVFVKIIEYGMPICLELLMKDIDCSYCCYKETECKCILLQEKASNLQGAVSASGKLLDVLIIFQQHLSRILHPRDKRVRLPVSSSYSMLKNRLQSLNEKNAIKLLYIAVGEGFEPPRSSQCKWKVISCANNFPTTFIP